MENTNPRNKELIQQFNDSKKSLHRQARTTIFKEGEQALVLLYNYLLSTTLPTSLLFNSLDGFLKVVRTIWSKPFRLAENETNIPEAICRLVKQVIEGFLLMIPQITTVFEKYVSINQKELEIMGIGTLELFIVEGWRLFLGKIRSVKKPSVPCDEFTSYLEASILAYIKNLPIMLALRDGDEKTLASLFDSSSDITLVPTMRYTFERLNRAYGALLLHYDDGVYFNFDSKIHAISYSDAFLSFEAEALIILKSRATKNIDNSSKKKTFSLKVSGFRSYLSSIIIKDLHDSMLRSYSTMTSAHAHTVGDDINELEDFEESRYLFMRSFDIPENRISSFLDSLSAKAKLNNKQARVIRSIYDTLEEKPASVAGVLGFKTENDYSQIKRSARVKIEAFSQTLVGKALFNTFGIPVRKMLRNRKLRYSNRINDNIIKDNARHPRLEK